MFGGTDGEQFVQGLCDESFFADYVFPNPRYTKGNKPKELCDALILFCSSAILIEVKTATELRESKASHERIVKWANKKTTHSIKQLSGAIRAIKHGLIHQVKNERRGIVQLEPQRITDYFGIVILDHPFIGLNGRERVGDTSDRSIVLNCNFHEFEMICDELSTMGDFLDYLRFRRQLVGRILFERSNELDLLVAYKTNRDLCERLCTESTTPIRVPGNQWKWYSDSAARRERKENETISFIVDALMDDMYSSAYVPFEELHGFPTGDALATLEKDHHLRILDVVAQLRRFERAFIGKKLYDKSRLHAESGRPRYFLFRREPLPPILFVVDDDGERSRRELALLVTAAQIKAGADEVLGIAISSHLKAQTSVAWAYSGIPLDVLSAQSDYESVRNAAEKLFKDRVRNTVDEWDHTSARSEPVAQSPKATSPSATNRRKRGFKRRPKKKRK